MESFKDVSASIARAADICLKPWKHAVFVDNQPRVKEFFDGEHDELILRIECRNLSGVRCPDNDLELEIYRSGNDFNLMLFSTSRTEQPILWQGQQSVWMDGQSGKRCQKPSYGDGLEAFTRRLRALFVIPENEK